MQKLLLCIVIFLFFFYIFTGPATEGIRGLNKCKCAFCHRCRKQCAGNSHCYRKCEKECRRRKRKAKRRRIIR